MRVVLGILVFSSLVYLALIVLGLLLFAIAWLVRRYEALSVPRRGLAPQAWVRDATGTPQPFLTDDQRDYGDEMPARDIEAEGGLGPILTPWPGFSAIDAVKRANPRLKDIQAYAVAVARSRLKAAR